jgi:hypothetical protein
VGYNQPRVDCIGAARVHGCGFDDVQFGPTYAYLLEGTEGLGRGECTFSALSPPLLRREPHAECEQGCQRLRVQIHALSFSATPLSHSQSQGGHQGQPEMSLCLTKVVTSTKRNVLGAQLDAFAVWSGR